ncbi:hypothetical protein P9112_002048 [Eukaryota sp. TZLM1-RC]
MVSCCSSISLGPRLYSDAKYELMSGDLCLWSQDSTSKFDSIGLIYVMRFSRLQKAHMLMEIRRIDDKISLVASSMTNRFSHSPEGTQPVTVLAFRRLLGDRSSEFESKVTSFVDRVIDESSDPQWTADLQNEIKANSNALYHKMCRLIADLYLETGLSNQDMFSQLCSSVLRKRAINLGSMTLLSPMKVDISCFDKTTEEDIETEEATQPFTPMSAATHFDSYSSIANTLQTGDLVFMRSRTVAGAIIRLGTNSEWSHIGMVINPKDCPNSDSTIPAQLLLFESSTNRVNQRSFLSGNVFRGVAIVSLRAKLFNSVYSYAAVSRLEGNVSRTELLDTLLKVKEELQGRPYEQSMFQLVRSIAGDTGFFRNRKVDLSSLFCSELVAEVFQRYGLLNKLRPSNTFVPEDFVPGKIEFKNGVTAGPLIYVEGLGDMNKEGGYNVAF